MAARSALQNYAVLIMPPPNGDGTTWYWFEQLYSPTVRRIHLEHFERVAFGMRGLAGFAAEGLPPNTVST